MEIHIKGKEISVWQLLFYISWAILSIWLILKVAGIIQTPLWLEYGVPIGSLIIGIFGLYHNIIEAFNKVSVNLAALSSKVDHIEKDLELVKTKVFI